jgi:lysophospholipase L1-like esterase
VKRLLTAIVLILAITASTAGDTLYQPASLRIVALGDSVTSGSGCGCTAFPSLYGDLLQGRTGDAVSVDNLGVGGLDSAGLLERLDTTGSPTANLTAKANVVLLTIGANDFGGRHDDVTAGRCTGGCTTAVLDQLFINLGQILARIETLRAGRPAVVLVTDYWNVFEDGQVARRSFPPSGRAATSELTRKVNAVIASTVRSSRAVDVDLCDPFERGNVTDLLAPDGDHPNAAGHALIARLLLAATPAVLTGR